MEPLEAAAYGDLRERFTDSQIVRGIRGLPDGFQPEARTFDLLRDIHQDAVGGGSVRSGAYRASERLDELEDQMQLEPEP